jgi:hypothetical protein
MNEYVITLPIYYFVNKKKQVLIGMNWFRNANYFVANKAKSFYHSLVLHELEGAIQLQPPLEVEYKIFVKRKGIDGMNVRAVVEKFALDGLKAAGVIEDDNIDIIIKDSSEYFYDKQFPRAEITIREINPRKEGQQKLDL